MDKTNPDVSLDVEQIKKQGGDVIGTTGIPLGTADMTAFLSKIRGNFDGLFGIFFGKDGVTIGNQAFDLGLTKKYRWAGDGAIAESTNLPALGNKIEGFVGINRYLPILDGVLNTPSHKMFLEEAVARLKQIDPSGPLPDRYVQSNFEAMNTLKLGMQKSGFRGREDTMKLIEALEGLEMKEGDDFPQGDKILRKADHQAFIREFIFEIKDGKSRILEVVAKEKTVFPPACRSSVTPARGATRTCGGVRSATTPEIAPGGSCTTIFRSEYSGSPASARQVGVGTTVS
jgi:branched-chain amino acid transport system substrate-binding protein